MVGSGNMDEQVRQRRFVRNTQTLLYVLRLISHVCVCLLEACIIDGLYRAVGVSAGGAFSPEDVRIIYQKVFHYPSMTNEVLVAMKKVNGCG